MKNILFFNRDEDYCSECGGKQIKENLYKSKINKKLYCIHCIGKIRLNREKKFQISRYEKKHNGGKINDKKILL